MMNRYFKKLLACGMCLFMLLGMSACKKDADWVFQLHGEIVNRNDVAAFSCIYTTEYNVTGKDQLDEIYEDSATYREYYMQQIEEDIISTVLLYKEAKVNSVKLSKEDKAKVESNADYVVERFSEVALEELGVSKADIERIYEMKMLGEAYLGTLSQNVGEELSVEERYIKVYQVTFPTVLLDENGMIQSDADGNLKMKSATEIAKMEQSAIAFADAAKQGERMEVLLKDCPSQVTGIEKHLKYNDLDKEYQDAVDKVAENGITDVIESDYGFSVLCVLDKNDETYAQTMSSHEEASGKVTAKEQELDRLYAEYAQANKEYKNEAAWDLVNIKDYIKSE